MGAQLESISFGRAGRSDGVPEGRAAKGTFRDFLAHLLGFESGIDPQRFDWYVARLDEPSVRYPKVTSPGRPVREAETGELIVTTLTVREYFATLAVADMFDASQAGCLRRMQYRAVNALGFVGYQIGERVLRQQGYYRPVLVGRSIGGRTCMLESYYVGGVPNAAWRSGVKEALHEDPETGELIVATDANRWEGAFTGKNGVFSLEDLLVPDHQEKVIVDLLRAGLEAVREGLERNGAALVDAFAGPRAFCMGEGLPDLDVRLTLSGILAAIHLRGVPATLDMVLHGRTSEDEFGTSILQYVVEFGGYDTSGM